MFYNWEDLFRKHRSKAKIDIYTGEYLIFHFVAWKNRFVRDLTQFYFFFNYRLLRVCPYIGQLDNRLKLYSLEFSTRFVRPRFFFYYVTRERKEKNFISINSFVNDRFEIEIEKLSNILQIEKKKKIKNFSILERYRKFSKRIKEIQRCCIQFLPCAE